MGISHLLLLLFGIIYSIYPIIFSHLSNRIRQKFKRTVQSSTVSVLVLISTLASSVTGRVSGVTPYRSVSEAPTRPIAGSVPGRPRLASISLSTPADPGRSRAGPVGRITARVTMAPQSRVRLPSYSPGSPAPPPTPPPPSPCRLPFVDEHRQYRPSGLRRRRNTHLTWERRFQFCFGRRSEQ